MVNSKIFLLMILFLSGRFTAAHEATRNGFENKFFPPVYLAATGEQPASKKNRPICRLLVTLIDADTGEVLPGLIRATDKNGVISVEGLVNRGLGLKEGDVAIQWYAVPKPKILELPRSLVTLEAVSGLDSELGKQTFDLSGKDEVEISIRLKRLPLLDNKGYFAGNTHVHLRRITRGESDDYLQAVGKADRVDLIFVSHLLRTSEDKTYISNEYRGRDLRALSTSATLFGFGEEHRNNFEAFGEGYGHVMFLDIDTIIKPVSIGSAIMDTGPDYPNLKQGIDQAHSQDATVIWCHNAMGHEDIPNWVNGKVHAQNIFDGGNHGTYEDTFYRYLNAGMRVPFSTGTDWFIYDFSRVYAQLDKPVSADNWLDALESGKTFITNGPLLQFSVGDKFPGDSLNMEKRGRQMVTARAQGRNDFGSIELIVNGEVVNSVSSRKVRGHYEAALDYSLSISEPSWVALRIPETEETNELGGKLFAHTSPIYITLGGKTVFSKNAAQSLIAEMRESMGAISRQARFDDRAQKAEVLGFYTEAIQELEEKISANSGSR